MSDSDTVETNLDDFEKQLYDSSENVVAEPEVEASENTPSATEEDNESKPEGDELEGEDGVDAPEETDADEEEETPKPKKRKNAQERIRELTADKYEMQRRLEALERAIVEKAGQKEETQTKTATVPVPEGAPSPDASKEDGSPLYPLGEFDPQYIADLTRFTIRQENEAQKKVNEEESRQKQVEAAQQELTKNWAAKVEASAERLPDLPEKFGILQETFKDIPPEQGNFIASSIMSLENGPDVLSYFADNLDEAKLLMKGGVFETIIALGRLDGEFSAKNKGVEREHVANKATNAPTPPPKNKGSGNVRSIRPDTPNLDDFEKLFYEK